MKITRLCKDCPEWTQVVCKHAFGVYWCIKSRDGKGCSLPIDNVAKAWSKAGWTENNGNSIPIAVPIKISQTNIQFQPPPLSDDDY